MWATSESAGTVPAKRQRHERGVARKRVRRMMIGRKQNSSVEQANRQSQQTAPFHRLLPPPSSTEVMKSSSARRSSRASLQSPGRIAGAPSQPTQLERTSPAWSRGCGRGGHGARFPLALFHLAMSLHLQRITRLPLETLCYSLHGRTSPGPRILIASRFAPALVASSPDMPSSLRAEPPAVELAVPRHDRVLGPTC